MKKPRNLFWILLCLCISPMIALAQDDCPAIVQAALTATDNVCSTTGRNQACYGNIDLQAVPQPGASLSFSKPGDLVDVGSVQSFVLSPLDLADKAWGVALMKLQANLPDTLPGQNVTFLLFGNVEIQNATAPAVTNGGSSAPPQQAPATVTLPGTMVSTAPVMESLTDTSSVPKLVNGGTQVTADGRDSMGQMIHIQLADGTSGWTVAQMVTVQGDVTTLPEVNIMDLVSPNTTPTEAPPAAETQQTPMQAFYFKTGANDAPCAQAPDSGILIQTPEGAGKITLNMNGVDVQLGSTAYVQAAPGTNDQTELTVNVVEGQGVVSSEGTTRIVPAGSRVRVPLQQVDNHLEEAGAPSEVEPYDAAALVALPVTHLERDITVAPALTAEQLAALTTSVSPISGTWHYTTGTAAVTGCPAELQTTLTTALSASATDVTISDGRFDFETMYRANNAEVPPGAVFGNPEPNHFTMDSSFDGGILKWDMHVMSPTLIQGQWYMAMEGCEVTVPFELQPVS